MKVALVNPPWSFAGSIYFGCREPHLPLELASCQVLLEAAGHECRMIDGHLFGCTTAEVVEQVAALAPDITVITTAPSYLFWRCAPPELRVPAQLVAALRSRGGRTVAVGPHGSATPWAALAKLGVDAVVRGECEEVVRDMAAQPDWSGMPAVASYRDGRRTGGAASVAASFVDLPPLAWPGEWIARHGHHHHRFDGGTRHGFGAEVEASRGCPYNCSFCAKIDFRDRYRRRDLARLLTETDRLLEQGVGYVYFIDEIFLPQRALLEALAERPVQFGIQTRIDLWKPDLLELLGKAGCVSIEAGVESLTVEGREALAKRCRLDTEDLARLLLHARRYVPFVQANLIGMAEDEKPMVEAWRDRMKAGGVWANEPVPLYPYPSSPDYRARWGEPDDVAWERAHAFYLDTFDDFSDIQEERPLSLQQLEAGCCPAH